MRPLALFFGKSLSATLNEDATLFFGLCCFLSGKNVSVFLALVEDVPVVLVLAENVPALAETSWESSCDPSRLKASVVAW